MPHGDGLCLPASMSREINGVTCVAGFHWDFCWQAKNLSVSICVICGHNSAFFHFQSISGEISQTRQAEILRLPGYLGYGQISLLYSSRIETRAIGRHGILIR
jgi:Zn ribbon nucleic-acid-binding protein